MSGDRARATSAALRLVQLVDVAGSANRSRLVALLHAGVTSIWLRDPAASGRALFDAATGLRAWTRAAGAELWIGDRVDVARAVEADGIQLGHRAVPAVRVRPWYPGRLGVSCHDEAELGAAQAAGADHVVLSPVFAVPGKGEALGLDRLASLVARTTIPVVALGGITPDVAARVRATGVAGIAVARALAEAADPVAIARSLTG